MTKKISPTRLVLIAIAMLSIQFVCSSSKTMISPVIHEMVKFYKADLGWTSLVGTIPSLTMVLGALVSGALANKYNNKLIAISGVILFFLGGVLPVFSDSFTVMLIWRGVLGFGAGLTRVFAMSWIPIFFKGRGRDIMMGLTNCLGGLLSSVASLIGGYLGKISWQAAFWGYALVLICALLIFVFVPEPTRIQKESDAEAGIVREEAKKEKQSMAGVPAIAWLYCAVMFLEFMCITIIYSVISSRLVAIGYTSVQAGVAISMTGYAMAVVSLIFGFVTRYVKRWGVVIAIALAAVSYFVLGYSGNLGMIYVACAVIGAAMGFSNSTIFNYVNIDCSGNIPMSNSIVLAGLTLGGFVSSFLLQAFVGMYGNNYSAIFNATGFLLVIILAFTTFVVIYANKRAQRLGQASTN